MSFVNIQKVSALQSVHGISEEQQESIIHFLQGSVYCWCKNRKDEAFAARDLLREDNYYWQDTPTIALFEYYRNGNDANSEYAIEEAGIVGVVARTPKSLPNIFVMCHG